VNQPEEYIAGLIKFVFQILFAVLEQRWVPGTVTLNEQASRLSDDEKMVIEIDDMQ